MEKADHDLIQSLAPSHQRLRELYDEHVRLEQEVEKFERYIGYSATVALQQKQLKKAKLRGMDDIMAILNEYRH